LFLFLKPISIILSPIFRIPSLWATIIIFLFLYSFKNFKIALSVNESNWKWAHPLKERVGDIAFFFVSITLSIKYFIKRGMGKDKRTDNDIKIKAKIM